jgi:hypothetical protein
MIRPLFTRGFARAVRWQLAVLALLFSLASCSGQSWPWNVSSAPEFAEPAGSSDGGRAAFDVRECEAMEAAVDALIGAAAAEAFTRAQIALQCAGVPRQAAEAIAQLVNDRLTLEAAIQHTGAAEYQRRRDLLATVGCDVSEPAQ